MELRHICYFVALAEELNYRQAAKRLNITPSPLSRQIQELESEIGVKLFYRNKRNVTLMREKYFYNKPIKFSTVSNGQVLSPVCPP